jgi:hypothetical protein
VHAPCGQPLAVEGTLELGVEAFGVFSHAVEPLVLVAGGGDHAKVFAAVEPGLGVLRGGKEGFPPVMIRMAGAWQGITRVELVADAALLVAGDVAFGLVTDELAELGSAVGGDDLLE